MKYIQELISRYPQLKGIEGRISCAVDTIYEAYQQDGKLMIAGNGGSAADAEHIVGELMKGFLKRRKISQDAKERFMSISSEKAEILIDNLQGGLPAIALTSHLALNTAVINDNNGNMSFAQQVFSLGKKNDVFLAISTSGNSENVILSAIVAKVMGMKVIGLTGESGGELKKYADVLLNVPEIETFKIQELHLPVYHCICAELEDRYWEM